MKHLPVFPAIHCVPRYKGTQLVHTHSCNNLLAIVILDTSQQKRSIFFYANCALNKAHAADTWPVIATENAYIASSAWLK